jgi:hypothetical protein
MLAFDFMCEALAHAGAAPGLQWRGPYAVSRDGPGGSIHGEFRFAGRTTKDAPRWMALDASVDLYAEVMRLRVRITLPRLRPGEDDYVLSVSLAYTSFHDTPVMDVEAETTSFERRRTVATFQRLVEAARVCSTGVGSAIPAALPPLGAIDPLDTFSALVLSRMYRWFTIDLAPESPALALLQAYALRALAIDGQDPLNLRGRLTQWLTHRKESAAADDPYFESILFDVDQMARKHLAGTMPDPPMQAPVDQLLLLRQAVAARPDVWRSVRLAISDARLAVAVGADIQPSLLPQAYLDELLAELPGLKPSPGLFSAFLPTRLWLTRP